MVTSEVSENQSSHC